MHIWRNHLIAGCVDKATFGKHGLLHIIYELYGAERTSTITAALSRLFTASLQRRGFTCGMSDVFLVESAEEERRQLLRKADVRCMEAAAKFVGMLGPELLVEQGMQMVSAAASSPGCLCLVPVQQRLPLAWGLPCARVLLCLCACVCVCACVLKRSTAAVQCCTGSPPLLSLCLSHVPPYAAG